MKLLNKSIYALSLVGMMGLWSCSSEEALPGGQTTVKGQPVPLTITVNRGDAQTRTTLTENAQAGLDSKWVEGDKVFVYNSGSGKVAELTLQSGAGSTTGVFTGTFLADGTESGRYHIWYYNESEDVKIVEDNPKGLWVNLASQSYPEAKDLAALDIMSTSGDLNDGGGVEISVKDGQASVTSDVTLESKLAMARFSLKGVGLPDGTEGTFKIYSYVNSNDTEIRKTRVNAKYAVTNVGISYNDGEALVVPNAKAGEDVFVALFPGNYRLGFEFITKVADGETPAEYVFEFNGYTDVEAGKYYNNGFNMETGEVEGAPIAFRNKDGRDNEKNFCVRYFRNFSIEDNQNLTATWTDWYMNETAAELEVEVKSYQEALKDYPLDSKYYEFQNWCPGLVYGMPTYQPGDKYTLSFDANDEYTHKYVDPTTGVALIWIDLHANWKFNYYLRFELDADSEVIVDSNVLETKYNNRVTEGGKLKEIVTHTNVSSNVVVSPILPDGISISKPGYTFKGWQRKDTGAVVDGNSFTHGNCIDDIDVTLVPDWEEETYEYTLIFEKVAGNNVSLGQVTFTGVSPLTINVLDKETEQAKNFRASKAFPGWAFRDNESVIQETLTFDKNNRTLTVCPRHWTWQVHFIDEVTKQDIQRAIPHWDYVPQSTFSPQFPTVPTHEGYTFTGWKYNGKTVDDANNKPQLTSSEMEPKVYATFKKNASSGTIVAPGAGGSDY